MTWKKSVVPFLSCLVKNKNKKRWVDSFSSNTEGGALNPLHIVTKTFVFIPQVYLLCSVYMCTLVTPLIFYLNVKCMFFSVTLATKRKEEEERNLTRWWIESTDERWPWLCTVWWWLRPRLWGLHVTLAPSPPPRAVQCHPGTSELCVAPFILLQWPEGLYQEASRLYALF